MYKYWHNVGPIKYMCGEHQTYDAFYAYYTGHYASLCGTADHIISDPKELVILSLYIYIQCIYERRKSQNMDRATYFCCQSRIEKKTTKINWNFKNNLNSINNIYFPTLFLTLSLPITLLSYLNASLFSSIIQQSVRFEFSPHQHSCIRCYDWKKNSLHLTDI